MTTNPLSASVVPGLHAVDLHEIREQRAKGWPDFHPETYCHRCGQRNLHSWWVQRELWDAVQGDSYGGGVLCPQCFTELYDERVGHHCIWEVRLDGQVGEAARDQLIRLLDELIEARKERPMSHEKLDAPEMQSAIARAKERASATEGGGGKTAAELLAMAESDRGVVPLVTGTDYEHRVHYEDGQPARAGLRRAEITISDEHLGDEEVLIHELAHVLTRFRYGSTVEVHGRDFVRIKDTMREAFGILPTGDAW